MSNVITAYFKGRIGIAEAVYQNDYGIIMAFDGIDLPEHFDCYFSVSGSDEAIPAIGADNRVVIPNTVLANSGKIEVHIPLHTGANDSEVEYVVYFKVVGRARPEDDGTPAQMTAIEQALALLQNPITNIEQIVNEALSFTGDTFAEMQGQLDADQAAFQDDMGDRADAFEAEIRSDIADVESDFDNLNAQYQTAVAAHTVDSEVQNVRVGADGVTYSSAGESVRTQFTDLKSDLNISSNPHLTVLCTPRDLTGDGFIRSESGTTDGAGFGFRYSDYINVSGVDSFYSMMPTFSSDNTAGLAFYDSNKTYIDGVKGRNTGTAGHELREIAVPDGAVYVRFSFRYSNIGSFYAKVDEITDVITYLDNITPYIKSIASPIDCIYDGSINAETGAVQGAGFGWMYSDYINIDGVPEFEAILPTFTSINTGGLAFYDSNKTYISGVKGRVTGTASYEVRKVPVPSNAVYVRFSIRRTNVESFYAKMDRLADITESESKSNSFAMQMFEKIGVIGDSISVGWAKDKNGNNSRRNTGISWVQQMARRLGCTAYNLGASGVDPIEWFQTNYEFYEYCYPQYQSVGACDLYIIGLGLNQGTLGSTADINQSDYTQNGATFYGQYARMIQMINAEHPNAIVMCLTEPTTAISSYDQAVRNICALNFINAELVDLENDYFDLFNTPEILAQHQPDGLHFTPYGYSLLAEAMTVALNDYISKHASKFKYVGVATV